MAKPAPQSNMNMGQPVPRIDARLKVTGGARYPADVAINNLAHGVLVTSTIAKGEVTALHLDEARIVPGVLDILTHQEVGDRLAKPKFGQDASSIAPLGDRKIWHDGQIVALVLAESAEAAREAASLVKVDYGMERPSATFDAEGAEVVEAVKASKKHEDPRAGDFEKSFAGAAVTVDAT